LFLLKTAFSKDIMGISESDNDYEVILTQMVIEAHTRDISAARKNL
jgi:hypothetical protein